MLQNQELFNTGLCSWSMSLYHFDKITKQENKLLIDYIQDNKPSVFSSLGSFLSQFKSHYYWKSGDIAPRIKWIKNHIKRN